MTGVHTPARAGWILLEHAGPWGPVPAVRSPLLPEELRAAVQRRRLRLQFVRRTGQRHTPSEFACLLVTPGERGGAIEQVRLRDPRALLDADLDAMAAGRPPGLGSPLDGPLYLVCTHGKASMCCLQFGRSVAAALAAVGGPRVWETSHVGGCRFAANVICLPDGACYRRVTVADLEPLVAAVEAGRIHPVRYGGRHGEPYLTQVADRTLREWLGLYGVDDVAAVAQRDLPRGRVEVTLLAAGASHRVVLYRDGSVPQ